jgi:hypothetical protein
MHVNQQFRRRYSSPSVIVTITDIKSDDWTQMITFKCEEDGSTGEMAIYRFRDLYDPYNPYVEETDG